MLKPGENKYHPCAVSVFPCIRSSDILTFLVEEREDCNLLWVLNKQRRRILLFFLHYKWLRFQPFRLVCALTLHFLVSLFRWFFSHEITVLDGFSLSLGALSCSALQLRAVFSMQLLHSLYAVFSMQPLHSLYAVFSMQLLHSLYAT